MQNGNGISGFTLLILACIFIPGLFLALLTLSLLCAIIWSIDSVVRKTEPSNDPGKIRLYVPAIAPVSALTERESNAIIADAITETNRQMNFLVCPDIEFRRRYFITVFTRLCARQGLTVDEFILEKVMAV